MTVITIMVLMVGVGTASFYWYIGPTVYTRPGLKFTAGKCGQDVEFSESKMKMPDGSLVPGMSVPRIGLRSATWRTDGKLLIDGVVVENCSTPPVEGDYVLQSGAIVLSHKRAPLPMADVGGKRVPIVAACNCPFYITYEIAGLARGDYLIRFPNTGMSVP